MTTKPMQHGSLLAIAINEVGGWGITVKQEVYGTGRQWFQQVLSEGLLNTTTSYRQTTPTGSH